MAHHARTACRDFRAGESERRLELQRQKLMAMSLFRPGAGMRRPSADAESVQAVLLEGLTEEEA